MNIGVLTSSRADYGIYLPLLKALDNDDFFNLTLIVFGSHLSKKHGNTVKEILKDGFKIQHRIATIPKNDSPYDIALSTGNTIKKFSLFWKKNKNNFDLVFCLGDRYEMFAAVTAGIPFQIKFAHLHGGERSEGVIDEVLRHSITLASKLHFTSIKQYAERVSQILNNNRNVYSVGALGLDNLKSIDFYSVEEFRKIYDFDLSKPTILFTFHPETVAYDKNIEYAKILCDVLESLDGYQILITLPNADTMGQLIRDHLTDLMKRNYPRINCYENLGTRGYFSAMKHCSFMLGNTSSGIIEAASLNKVVINLGDRQKGRIHGDNVLDAPINKKAIFEAIDKTKSMPDHFLNPYYSENVSAQIVKILKAQSKNLKN